MTPIEFKRLLAMMTLALILSAVGGIMLVHPITAFVVTFGCSYGFYLTDKGSL